MLCNNCTLLNDRTRCLYIACMTGNSLGREIIDHSDVFFSFQTAVESINRFTNLLTELPVSRQVTEMLS